MRLSRDEFRRLWDLHPEIKRAERIEGVVVMPAAAVRHHEHGRPHLRMSYWLSTYEFATPGTEGSVATTVAIDPENDPEPDGLLFIRPDAGGRCVLTDDGYLEGSPELAAEISASTTADDLGRKLRIYERNGVEEYIVWLTEQREIRWFRLRDGRYQPLTPDPQGIVRSEVFPGLWLDVPAMLRDDVRQMLAVLNQGIATPEHAAFVETLAWRIGGQPGTAHV